VALVAPRLILRGMHCLLLHSPTNGITQIYHTLLPVLSALSSDLSLLRCTLPRAPTSSIYHARTSFGVQSFVVAHAKSQTPSVGSCNAKANCGLRPALPDAGERGKCLGDEAGCILEANDEVSFDDHG
jgi:hypothetical protein